MFSNQLFSEVYRNLHYALTSVHQNGKDYLCRCHDRKYDS